MTLGNVIKNLESLLGADKTPAPTVLLAHLIALRLSHVTDPADCAEDYVAVELPLRDGNTLEMYSWISDGKLRNWNGVVGMPPRGERKLHSSLVLTGSAREVVAEALLSLWRRVREGREVESDYSDQGSAVLILEKFL